MKATELSGDLLDAQLKDSISTAFLWNWLMSNESISISVTDGWVILEGELDHQYQIRTAENLVAMIPGVKGVISRLLLNPQRSGWDFGLELNQL